MIKLFIIIEKIYIYNNIRKTKFNDDGIKYSQTIFSPFHHIISLTLILE